jgi:hypothetical protein
MHQGADDCWNKDAEQIHRNWKKKFPALKIEKSGWGNNNILVAFLAELDLRNSMDLGVDAAIEVGPDLDVNEHSVEWRFY